MTPRPVDSEIGALPTEIASGNVLRRESQSERVPTLPTEGVTDSDADGVFPERYEKHELLAIGGMGEIRRVWDRVLRRSVAMKLLSWSLLHSSAARARFRAETELTAGLEHPGIVSIYDAGELESGRPWYTMRLLPGRTFDQVIAAAHAEPEGVKGGLGHLVRAFHAVCEAMSYAHARQVIHRDLKPQNVMVDRLGEVLILDWGLARRGAAERTFDDPDRLGQGPGSAASLLTHAGDILGTPAYMPPEQARGELESVGPPSDVYALGAILHEILCGAPPFSGDASGILRLVRGSSPAPLASRLSESPLVGIEPLVQLCERCLLFEPRLRPEVETLVEELRLWRERERRGEEARKVVVGVAGLEPEISELKARAAELREQARALHAELRSYSPAEDKAASWQLEADADELERQAALRSVYWLQGLRAALSIEPSCLDAHTRLARHYALGLREAEARRDPRAIAACQALLREHDRGEHRALLAGHGRVSLVTTPASEVTAYRYVERLRRLEPVHFADLGRTPISELSLPAGSYLLVLRAEGSAPVHYPVRIGRDEHWDGVGPGGGSPRPLPLPPASEFDPERMTYVPAGWFSSGGDDRAVETLPERRVWVDGFVVQRHPVDNRSYLAFLNDCVARGDAPAALRHAPRLPRGSGGLGGVGALEEPLAYARRHSGEFVLAAPSAATPWELDGPVALVDWHSAVAYAGWYAARTGRPFRLLNELEWEKAARAVDGRIVSFGDHVEPTRACMLGSHDGTPRPMDVRAFAEDESPYGVRGMTGNVRDWCENTWQWDGPRLSSARLVRESPAESDPSLRSVRGGAWSAMPDFCRAAGRFALAPGERLLAVGFRLAYSWPF